MKPGTGDDSLVIVVNAAGVCFLPGASLQTQSNTAQPGNRYPLRRSNSTIKAGPAFPHTRTEFQSCLRAYRLTTDATPIGIGDSWGKRQKRGTTVKLSLLPSPRTLRQGDYRLGRKIPSGCEAIGCSSTSATCLWTTPAGHERR